MSKRIIIPWSIALCGLCALYLISFSGEEPNDQIIFQRNVQIGCAIYDWDLIAIRRFPGNFCIFYPDGKVLSAGDKDLTLFSSRMAVIWRKKVALHHVMNLSLDGKDIYGLASEIHKLKGERVRYERILRINSEGEISGEFNFFKHSKRLDALFPNGTPVLWSAPSYYRELWDKEYGHANSVYVISPGQAAPNQAAAFAAGNVIVSVNAMARTLILDPELKTVLWSYPRKEKPQQHDVQPTENGNLMSYINFNTGKAKPFSSLEEFNPLTGALHWRYRANPPSSFFSETQGGVQKLPNGHTLFTDTTLGGRVVLLDRHLKKVWERSVPWRDKNTGKPGSLQTAKVIEASSFLTHSTGP